MLHGTMWFLYALLSPVFYGALNVIDSILVKKYTRNAMAILWACGIAKIPIVTLIPFFIDVRSQWMLPIVLTSLLAYGGDFLYYRALRRLDVSVLNAGWAVLAIVISIGGFVFFNESWNMIQSLGVIMVLGGVVLLSLWHKNIPIFWAAGIFLLLSFAYSPGLLVTKASQVDGAHIIVILYWFFLTKTFVQFFLPLLRSNWRRAVIAEISPLSLSFGLFIVFGVVCWILGAFFSILAVRTGFVSLVSVVGNVQPFVVILMALVIAKLLPMYSPRELLTAQSVQIKLVSFCIVFVGLAMLAVG